jgi:heme A synthase
MSQAVATLEYRWAQITAAATFLLIMAGGLVNPTGSSLACPEAFVICHGQLFPALEGGVLFEHGHRLIAMTVGLLQLGLTVLLWRRRPALRGWAVAALALVAVQALLGALTVYFQLPWFVSTAHLMVAMTYFAMTLHAVRRTRPVPPVAASPIEDEAERARLRRWIAIGGAAVLVQILLGGLVRHHGAALASVDLPLHEGQLWPAGAPFALQLHIAHRLAGVVIGLVAIATALAIAAASRRPDRAGLRRAALAVPVAVLAQVTLGIFIVLTYRSVPVVIAHFGGAALLWGLYCAMWLMTGSRGPAPQVQRESTRRASASLVRQGAIGGAP